MDDDICPMLECDNCGHEELANGPAIFLHRMACPECGQRYLTKRETFLVLLLRGFQAIQGLLRRCGVPVKLKGWMVRNNWFYRID